MSVKHSTIFLDKEGRWFHEGIQITHQRTCLLFARTLRKGSDDLYSLKLGNEWARVEVEDSPYMAKSVTVHREGNNVPMAYLLHLNDETEEFLDPQTLSVGKGNVMYCKVKQGKERARFLRPAYYQLCLQIETNTEENSFWLPCEGKRIPILPLIEGTGPGEENGFVENPSN